MRKKKIYFFLGAAFSSFQGFMHAPCSCEVLLYLQIACAFLFDGWLAALGKVSGTVALVLACIVAMHDGHKGKLCRGPEKKKNCYV